MICDIRNSSQANPGPTLSIHDCDVDWMPVYIQPEWTHYILHVHIVVEIVPRATLHKMQSHEPGGSSLLSLTFMFVFG